MIICRQIQRLRLQRVERFVTIRALSGRSSIESFTLFDHFWLQLGQLPLVHRSMLDHVLREAEHHVLFRCHKLSLNFSFAQLSRHTEHVLLVLCQDGLVLLFELFVEQETLLLLHLPRILIVVLDLV